MANWPIDENGTFITPTKDQTLAAIKTSIGGLGNKTITTMEYPYGIDYQKDLENKLETLYTLKNYAGSSYKPLVAWLNSTISYFEEAKRLFEKNPEDEEAKSIYENGRSNIIKFMKALGSDFA